MIRKTPITGILQSLFYGKVQYVLTPGENIWLFDQELQDELPQDGVRMRAESSRCLTI